MGGFSDPLGVRTGLGKQARCWRPFHQPTSTQLNHQSSTAPCAPETQAGSLCTWTAPGLPHRETLLHSHSCNTNVVPRGPQVGDKTMIDKAGAPVLHTVKEHEERREAAPGNSREVMQRLEPTPNQLKMCLQLLPLFPIISSDEDLLFCHNKEPDEISYFKQPTFYKNQIGTRSQLCNPWNHRQKQLIQWKARAGCWLKRSSSPHKAGTQGTEAMKRSRNHSWAQAQNSLGSAFSLQTYLQQQVATMYVCFSSYTALETVSLPHYEVT